MNGFGQLSLEYLLILLAAFSVFAVLIPLMNSVYSAGLFGLDSVNASHFSLSLQEGIEEMGFQADGSRTLVSANPLYQWKLLSKDDLLEVVVTGPDLRKKTFEVKFPNSISQINLQLDSKKDFLLERVSGKILFVDSNP